MTGVYSHGGLESSPQSRLNNFGGLGSAGLWRGPSPRHSMKGIGVPGWECFMWKTHYWFNIQSRHWNLHRFVYDAAVKNTHLSVGGPQSSAALGPDPSGPHWLKGHPQKFWLATWLTCDKINQIVCSIYDHDRQCLSFSSSTPAQQRHGASSKSRVKVK